MKYDDASWHYGGNFPTDLPAEAGATHIGMFVAWAWLTGLAGEDVMDDMPEAVTALNERTTTPGKSFFDNCDGKFVDKGNDNVTIVLCPKCCALNAAHYSKLLEIYHCPLDFRPPSIPDHYVLCVYTKDKVVGKQGWSETEGETIVT